ncbi:uncharacterized protein LOC129188655 [Dunckerocampus dactyliophorus]|uniref:uncharacterized protein LOC129188655 n=1 Tax=Dunckerocampus dactyliophorus TaxID=161453 RepID=UPI0024061CA3|nr:uncharacterized protein LOC129188655 [Dunckerocampus dactyliophorus]
MADREYIPERRMVLIGDRWSGKSSCGNTILRKESFECGRTRTTQSEVRHEEVEGRNLVVVDAPGWKTSRSLREIPEGDKQRFKLNASKCLPGPHAFLLVVPIDSAFSVDQRKTVQEHMKLLGERAWRYSMVLFTCGDFLAEKTIEQHIESEGPALKWLIEKCNDRYHVFSNKDKSNLSQVTQLMKKIDELVEDNEDSFYELDEHTLLTIEKKQEEVAKRAVERKRRADEQRKQLEGVRSEMTPIRKLQLVLLGSRFVGKTSVGNTILGITEHEEGRRTTRSLVQQGSVGRTEITIVDTPGWWKSYPACDTPEVIKDEVKHSMFMCSPGPHVFLLVIDAEASFNTKHLDAATSHVELLGEGVWEHTMVVFTKGDWLGERTIEEYIEGEGKALQSLVDRCGNRYHVLDNSNEDDGTQVNELMEKIALTTAGNQGRHFVPNKQMLVTLMAKKRQVEEAAKQRQSQVKATREIGKGPTRKLKELRLMILGHKTAGKTSVANYLLQSILFPTHPNDECRVGTAQVADKEVTVVDTTGWYRDSSRCIEKQDREIVRGLTLSPKGVHAVLIVIPLDMKFKEAEQDALEDHMKLFGDTIWNHTMVLFTNMDTLADISLEEYIELEHSALQWLVDKCQNKYHYLNVTRKASSSQLTQLFEKIEEMSAKNGGHLFRPDMKDINLRIEEKFQKRKVTNQLEYVMEEMFRRRELQLMVSFKDKFLQLQKDITDLPGGSHQKLLGITRKDNDKKECVLSKINQEIEELDKAVMKLTNRNSMDFLQPTMSTRPPDSENVLEWLEWKVDQMTSNLLHSSEYSSMATLDNTASTQQVD